MYFVNLLKLIPFAADVINTALSQYTADRINSFDHHWNKKKLKIVKRNHQCVAKITPVLPKLHLCYKNYTYVAKNTLALQKPSQVGNLNPVSSVCQFSVSSHIIFFHFLFFSD